MKKILLAAAAATAFAAAGSASALTGDSETLVYNLNGEVASVCTLSPDGPVNFNVNMTNFGNQGITGITYSCNSPYKLTIKSDKGGMEHQESNGAIRLEYDIKFVGFTQNVGFNAGTLQSQNIMSETPFLVNSAWESIASNSGAQAGTLELDLPPSDQQAVAGTYKDKLTITLKATL